VTDILKWKWQTNNDRPSELQQTCAKAEGLLA